MADLDALAGAVVSGAVTQVETLVDEAIAGQVAAGEILARGLIAGMTVVGQKFKDGEIFVPEVLFSARAMKAGLEKIKPLLVDKEVPTVGLVVLGTVQGDLHDIGKNLVGIMLEGGGFKVIDLGTNVPADKFVAAVKEHRPQILGMSALLTTTMPNMKAVIEALEREGLRGGVKVMVGGAPVTPKFARQIGADGYGEDGGAAVELARSLVGAS